MAAKKEETTSERTYNVPLRKEYLTEKAVSALRKFIGHHMKSENVKIGKEVNEFLWHHGIRNPPHHLKVNAVKDKEGKVMIELFGVKKKEPKENKKAQKAKKAAAEKKEAAK